MSYIKIYNKSQEDISFLKSIESKIKPFLSLVNKEEYPITVIVYTKKNKQDLSNLDLESNRITLKYNSKLQSKEDICWVLLHEIGHWLSLKNPELKKVAFSEENKYVQKALNKVYAGYDWHDALSYEIFANTFATLLIGKFFKRHNYKNKIK